MRTMEACQGSCFEDVEAGLTESAFCCVCGAADESLGCVTEVIKLLQEEASCYPQPSESRRKFTLRRIMGKLTKTTNHLEGIKMQTMHLNDEVMTLQDKLKESQIAQMEVLNRMDGFAIDMQETLLRLREEEDEKSKVLQELREANCAMDMARERFKLKEMEHELQLKGYSKLLEEDGRLRSENERLDCEVKEYQAHMKESEEAQKDAAKALAQLEKYKEVIAKISADNMVFLMKLKQSEASLAAAQAQVTNLQEERASWLEEASAEIQGAVRVGLGKTVNSESELEVLHGERQQLQSEVQEAAERVSRLTKAKERLEERLSCLEDENTNLQQSLNSEMKQRENAEAEARVLLNSLKQSNDELVEARRQHKNASADLEKASKILAKKNEKVENLFVALKNSSAQLGTQQAINAAIMKKKEEMEWKCLGVEAERDKLMSRLKGRDDDNYEN